MEFKNEQAKLDWEKTVAANQDEGYGQAGVSFAQRWVELMETSMKQGGKISVIAEKLASVADIEGITGFQYHCAKKMIEQWWRWGDVLKESVSKTAYEP